MKTKDKKPLTKISFRGQNGKLFEFTTNKTVEQVKKRFEKMKCTNQVTIIVNEPN